MSLPAPISLYGLLLEIIARFWLLVFKCLVCLLIGKVAPSTPSYRLSRLPGLWLSEEKILQQSKKLRTILRYSGGMRLSVWGLVPLFFLPYMTGCRPNTNVSAPDRTTALRISDAFMSDLIADHIDAAADKMGQKFIDAVGGKPQAEEKIRELMNYCGRPLESELRHEETGVWAYTDGRSPAPLRMFVYSGKTTQNPKGVCFFAVRIVAGKNGAELINFGPLKLTSGELPEWAR